GKSGPTAVDGAKVVAIGNVVEATLPVAALPLLSAAPLDSLAFAAAPGSAPAPEPFGADPEDGCVWPFVAIPPVAFQPYASLRAQLWTTMNPMAAMLGPWRAYDPGSPAELVVAHYTGSGKEQ